MAGIVIDQVRDGDLAEIMRDLRNPRSHSETRPWRTGAPDE